MTVKELKEKLDEMDDSLVIGVDTLGGFAEIQDVVVESEIVSIKID